jgi:thiol-disulfide isomerase/thioredoxin
MTSVIRMNRVLLLAAALACVAGQAALAGQNGALTIGNPAPKIAVKEFVKGSPVTAFNKGQLYVVEFWATWCGPCKESIPHLTELQKKYPQVKFVGVSVWEENQSAVKPFVKQMGGKMAYCVAMDSVPPGKSGNDGAMARTWMQAAGQNGIPTAFIVNKQGRIAWIGHPMELEQPLKTVVAGKWDMNSARSTIEKQQEQSRKMMALSRKLQQASQSGDPKQMIAVIDQAIAEDPAMEEQLGVPKFTMLLKEPDQAAEYGQHLVDKTYADNPVALNQLSWTVVDPAKPKADAKLLDVALKAAQRADELSKGKDPAISDTLGCAYFATGNTAKAIEAQERAVRLAKGTQFEKDPDIAKRLEQYRKAAGR